MALRSDPTANATSANNGGFSWVPSRGTMMPGAPEPHEYIGGSIQRVDLATGKVETLFDKCGAHPLKGPNDLVFDRAWRALVHRSRQAPCARSWMSARSITSSPAPRRSSRECFGMLPAKRYRIVAG